MRRKKKSIKTFKTVETNLVTWTVVMTVMKKIQVLVHMQQEEAQDCIIEKLFLKNYWFIYHYVLNHFYLFWLKFLWLKLKNLNNYHQSSIKSWFFEFYRDISFNDWSLLTFDIVSPLPFLKLKNLASLLFSITFFWIHLNKNSYKVSKITQIRMKISGITPIMPVKELETIDSKILFLSLIAVGFNTRKIPTLQKRINKT